MIGHLEDDKFAVYLNENDNSATLTGKAMNVQNALSKINNSKNAVNCSIGLSIITIVKKGYSKAFA